MKINLNHYFKLNYLYLNKTVEIQHQQQVQAYRRSRVDSKHRYVLRRRRVVRGGTPDGEPPGAALGARRWVRAAGNSPLEAHRWDRAAGNAARSRVDSDGCWIG